MINTLRLRCSFEGQVQVKTNGSTTVKFWGKSRLEAKCEMNANKKSPKPKRDKGLRSRTPSLETSRGYIYQEKAPLGLRLPRTSGGSILRSGDSLGEGRALGPAGLGLQPVGELGRVVPAALLVACGGEGRGGEGTREGGPEESEGLRPCAAPTSTCARGPRLAECAHPASHTAPPSPLPHGQRGSASVPGRPRLTSRPAATAPQAGPSPGVPKAAGLGSARSHRGDSRLHLS